MLENISLLEAAFTTVGALVLALIIQGFADVQEDYVIARNARHKILPRTVPALEVKFQQALDNRSEEVDRVLILLWCVAIGTGLMTRPPTRAVGGGVNWISMLLGFGILMIEIVVARRAILKRLSRYKQINAVSNPKQAKVEAIEAIIQRRQRQSDPPVILPDNQSRE